jgi:hypothetical protein
VRINQSGSELQWQDEPLSELMAAFLERKIPRDDSREPIAGCLVLVLEGRCAHSAVDK